MTQDIPDTETINAFNKSIIDEFRANAGKVGGQFAGADPLTGAPTPITPAQRREAGIDAKPE